MAQTNFGSVNLGSAVTQAVTVSLPAAAKLSGIAVRTEGAANLDFTNAGGGTCAVGTSYSAGATCTVEVSFKPGYVGTRDGAAVLESAAGTAATAYLQGIGLGPQEAQIAFQPGAQKSIIPDVAYAFGAAVDGSGNIYLANESYLSGGPIPPRIPGSVTEYVLSQGKYTETEIGSGFGSPEGVAVDGGGNVYIADFGFYVVYYAGGNRITTYIPPNVYKETLEPDGSYAQSTIGSSWNSPSAVAVEGGGNVYVAETGVPVYGAAGPPEVYQETLLPNGSYAQTAIGSGWNSPFGIAVDGNGNVYVADSGPYSESPAVYKLTRLPGGGYAQAAIVEGLSGGLAVGGSGNLFIADGAVYKETLQPNGTYAQGVAAAADFGFPSIAAVDASGKLYISYPKGTSLASATVSEAEPRVPPALSFATTVMGSTSTDSPQVVTISNAGEAALTFSELSYPADFPEAGGVANECASGTSLAPKESCELAIDFKPTAPLGGKASVVLRESVKFTTNGLSGKVGEQAIQVSGTELKQ